MNQVRGIFGLGPEDNIGKIAFPAIQVGFEHLTEITAVHDGAASAAQGMGRAWLQPSRTM